MLDDDALVGRVLNRRELLALFGKAGVVLMAAACAPDAPARPVSTATPGVLPIPTSSAVPLTAAPSCIVRPALTEGPYFVDEKINRSDIRSDPSDNSTSPGVPLKLAITVGQMGGATCTPLSGAQVDIWQCDAAGVYSDVRDPGFSSAGKKFLRGYQLTNDKGLVEFTTIYPGWYRGRAVHIHFKIRTAAPGGRNYDFTSQFFFDDTLSDQVLGLPPYVSRGQRDTRNDRDSIFRGSNGQLTLALTKEGEGYTGRFDVGLQIA